LYKKYTVANKNDFTSHLIISLPHWVITNQLQYDEICNTSGVEETNILIIGPVDWFLNDRILI